MRIIKATIEFIDILVPLFDGYRMFYEQASDQESARKFLTARLNNNESVVLLAVKEEDGKHIGMGFTQLYPSFSSVTMKRTWILNDLFVEGNYRSQGVGEALINAAVELGKNTAARQLTLETHMTNASAQRLYDKLGWEKDDEHFFYYLPL